MVVICSINTYHFFDYNDATERGSMKNYAIGLYEKAIPKEMSWKEKLECARECGYDYLEISIDETEEKLARLDWTDKERRELLCCMQDSGLPIRSMCLSGHRKYPFGSGDMRTRERSMEIMEKAVRLADDLGIRIIQLAGYDVYYEKSSDETIRRFRENLRRASAMASERGILLGFETMETEFMNTTEKAMRYVHEIDSPFLGVYPDVGNLTNAALSYGNTVEEDLEKGRGHIIALHLKETLPGLFREIPFTKGHVDFPAVIRKAWDLGIRRYVTEMWDVGKISWKEDILFANRMMRGILDGQAER